MGVTLRGTHPHSAALRSVPYARLAGATAQCNMPSKPLGSLMDIFLSSNAPPPLGAWPQPLRANDAAPIKVSAMPIIADLKVTALPVHRSFHLSAVLPTQV